MNRTASKSQLSAAVATTIPAKSALIKTTPMLGATFMVFAALAFAGVNAANDWSQQFNGVSPSAVAFFQYFFALIFAIPWIWRHGRKALATNHLGLHILRVALSAVGVQAFVASFAIMPFPQIIALVMVSPFFIH